MTLLPRTLAGRTALLLIPALLLVELAAFTLLASDRVESQRLADSRDFGSRVVALYRTLVLQPEAWTSAVRDLGSSAEASIETAPPGEALPSAPLDVQRLIRPYLGIGAMPAALRPRAVLVRGRFESGSLLVTALQLPDERWLFVRTEAPAHYPWHSRKFVSAFAIVAVATVLLGLWAINRLGAPLRTLAAAAERFGRDVNAPSLPESGPEEVAAAAAFNTMAARVRRFVSDRTFLLTAIGHDLKTPITRLKLRAEWMEDEEQRRKMLADLDELEAMVSATLAFGRDVAGSEQAVQLDLAALVRTVLDEAADARPAATADTLSYQGPEHLTVQGRPVALKRALANLVGNALAYGGLARVVLEPPQAGLVAVQVEDAGPGIPPEELERVFEPFRRLETSRNRETGGTGLGLPIVRNILRAHGGDVTLSNKPEGGIRATVTLPA